MAQPARILGPSADGISDAEYHELRALIYRVCGVTLGAGKKALVVGRLHSVLAREGFADFASYYRNLRSDPSGKLISELVDRITTNHTFFNREHAHFDFLRHVALPEVVGRRKLKRQNKLRIWCAASSFGQEPYTLAMIAMEVLGQRYAQWDAGVLATDISTAALAKARAATYTSNDIEQLPDDLRKRFFERLDDGRWRAKDSLRNEVLFRRFNLMSPKLPFKDRFDVIFCRNVMIYFDDQAKSAVVARLQQQLELGGYLFIGAAESLPRGHRLTPVGPSIFRRDLA